MSKKKRVSYLLLLHLNRFLRYF